MSEEEYEDEYDPKRIGALIIVLAVVSFILLVFFEIIDFGTFDFSSIELPKTEKTNEVIETPNPNIEGIKPEYQKYIDFGISNDDIIDFQNLDCTVFEPENENLLSTDPKFEQIIQQRRSEC